MNMSQEEQIARQFVQGLEADSQAESEFFMENRSKSIWLQCPPLNGEPVNFWQYGPPIPSAKGYIYLLGSIWYDTRLEGWIVQYGNFTPFFTNLAIDEAKKELEKIVSQARGIRE